MENVMRHYGIELREEQKIPLRSLEQKDIFAMLPTGSNNQNVLMIFETV